MIVPPAYLDRAQQEGCSDLTALAASGDLKEDTILILNNLRRRYEATPCQPYTAIGPVLIAVNPGALASKLYSDQIQALYSRMEGSSYSTLPPHLYKTAYDMFSSISCRQSSSESVIITGESGAGKTESAKHLVRFVLSMNAQPDVMWLQDRILQNSAVLEAFGNAKTSRNDNSSRFGKMLSLHFDNEELKTCGAAVQTFLLEKSRVVKHSDGERSFHSFYWLLLEEDPSSDQQVNTHDPWTYKYLQPSANALKDPSARKILAKQLRLESIDPALSQVGVTNDERHGIRKLLAAILLLGNVTFVDGGEDTGATLDGESANIALEEACGLLSIQCDVLLRALTETIMPGNVVIPRSYGDAMASRDALAKGLYAGVFEWLVERLNEGMSIADSAANINILDIFGFEDLEANSFEQLQINYANEKIHGIFVDAIFRAEQEEYIREGVQYQRVDYPFSRVVLDALEGPGGVMRSLEDSCRKKTKNLRQEKEQERSLMSALAALGPSKGTTKGQGAVVTCKAGDVVFQVQHFAGQVEYRVKGFVSKNKDRLQPELLSAVASSTDLWIKGLLGSGSSAQGIESSSSQQQPAARSTMASSTTLTSQFRSQLRELVEVLGMQPMFVRCIKPREPLHSGLHFDEAKVAFQLACSGVLETVRVKTQGWAVRLPLVEFHQLFGKLASAPIQQSQEPPAIAQNVCEMMQFERSTFAVGVSKIFLASRRMVETLHERRISQRQRVMVKLHGIVARKRRTTELLISFKKGVSGVKNMKRKTFEEEGYGDSAFLATRADMQARHYAAQLIQRAWSTKRSSMPAVGRKLSKFVGHDEDSDEDDESAAEPSIGEESESGQSGSESDSDLQPRDDNQRVPSRRSIRLSIQRTSIGGVQNGSDSPNALPLPVRSLVAPTIIRQLAEASQDWFSKGQYVRACRYSRLMEMLSSHTAASCMVAAGRLDGVLSMLERACAEGVVLSDLLKCEVLIRLDRRAEAQQTAEAATRRLTTVPPEQFKWFEVTQSECRGYLSTVSSRIVRPEDTIQMPVSLSSQDQKNGGVPAGKSVVLEAVLSKLSHGAVKRWQTRRFVLTDRALLYFKIGERYTEPTGGLTLDDVQEVDVNKSTLVIRCESNGGRELSIKCAEEATAQEWATAVQSMAQAKQQRGKRRILVLQLSCLKAEVRGSAPGASPSAGSILSAGMEVRVNVFASTQMYRTSTVAMAEDEPLLSGTNIQMSWPDKATLVLPPGKTWEPQDTIRLVVQGCPQGGGRSTILGQGEMSVSDLGAASTAMQRAAAAAAKESDSAAATQVAGRWVLLQSAKSKERFGDILVHGWLE